MGTSPRWGAEGNGANHIPRRRGTNFLKHAARTYDGTVTAATLPKGRVRTDIQAMRALAVLLVVIYHFWPEGPFTGGYVGVDVFFVISGFLITGHLIRGIEHDSFQLRNFWLRRARRLLPAALVVIFATVAATPLLLPQTMWADTFSQAIASSLYVQNFALTLDSVDYLAEGSVPTPLQHYWSLSVEEQFYIAWPLFLVMAALLGRRLPRIRHAIPATIGAVILVSFVSSVVLTNSFPGAAYFIPLTRAWEFGIGAVVYLTAERWSPPRAARLPLALGGTAAVIVSALLFDSSTPFPGSLALVPVIGSALIIAAAHEEGRVGKLIAARPVQGLGAISYSLYLWHWPIAVFFFTMMRTLGLEVPPVLAAIGLLLICIPIAWITKKFVEDAALRGRAGRSVGRPIGVLLASTIAVVALAGALTAIDNGTRARLESIKAAGLQSESECLGARSLGRADCGEQMLIGPPVLAEDDLPVIYAEGCQAGPREDALKSCEFGSETGPHIALVGDSHATSWFPALERLAQERGWHITTFLKSSCRWSTYQNANAPLERASCVAWNARLAEELRTSNYAAVLTGYFSRSTDVEESGQLAEGFRQAWDAVDPDTQIVAMVDTPSISPGSSFCLFGSSAPPSACAEPPATQQSSLKVLEAADAGDESVEILNMNYAFMQDGKVATVVGGLVVWRDQHHFTASYSESLAPLLEAHIADEVEGRGVRN
jgi:peptidoglycan/LPS O-acetylase OafA/YrhL